MILFKSNKGQGITLNTIIIAALVVIVLIVLIMIFTGRMNLFGTGAKDAADSCIARGGHTCSTGCGDLDNRVRDTKGVVIANCCTFTHFCGS